MSKAGYLATGWSAFFVSLTGIRCQTSILIHMQKKRFIKLPEYPGGKEEFQKYIHENLKYPKTALNAGIQGVVHLSAEINDNGEVLEVQVDKGLGHGCDEEAVRLIKGCHFGGVKNRGIRLKTRKKFRIPFQLIKNETKDSAGTQNVVYNFKPAEGSSANSQKDADNQKNGTVYSYTINVSKRP